MRKFYFLPAILFFASCTGPLEKTPDKKTTLEKIGLDPSKLNIVLTWNETCPMCKVSREELMLCMEQFPEARWNVLRADSFSHPGFGKVFSKEIHEWPDLDGILAKSLNFKVTPTLAIYAGQGNLKYFGPVDDRGVEIGRFKSKIGNRLLFSALEKLGQDTARAFESHKAVGCFLP